MSPGLTKRLTSLLYDEAGDDAKVEKGEEGDDDPGDDGGDLAVLVLLHHTHHGFQAGPVQFHRGATSWTPFTFIHHFS